MTDQITEYERERIRVWREHQRAFEQQMAQLRSQLDAFEMFAACVHEAQRAGERKARIDALADTYVFVA